MPDLFVRVALDVPGAEGFDYGVTPEQAGAVREGVWVLVPWGRGRRIGLVTGLREDTPVPPDRLRALIGVLDDAPAPDPDWLALLRFAARYYHRTIGEVALPAIPRLLRTPPAARSRGSVFARARAKGPGAVHEIAAGGIARRRGAPPPTAAGAASPPQAPPPSLAGTASSAQAPSSEPPELTEAQRSALDALAQARGFAVHLLHGATGSGKTEVYLHWLARVLGQRPDAQVLLLVPEIALTPQLIRLIEGRFAGEPVAVLHSELPDGERAAHWLAAADARVRVVVGTRLAVLTPLPRLAAIVVDEENDASYKQQEGVRYSARDLAVALAQQRDVPVVLGSATPSLESWLAARRGRYRLLSLPERVGGGSLPRLQTIDPRGRALRHGLAPDTVEAIGAAIGRGEQALVFLNRRGFAPVLACGACGWVSGCQACSAHRVLHRQAASATAAARGDGVPDAEGGTHREAAARGAARPARYRLVCHHCGAEGPVPRACPDCGNVDLSPVGRGTQRLEEGLAEVFPGARIVRVDRDVARRRDAAKAAIDAAHAGDVDILVGTQMLAKGHDFRRLSVVAVLDVDAALYSSDFRAPERLFALLMQVAGRAGRSAQGARVIVQTRFPAHPVFAALARHDYAGFADRLLAERREAGLPPFTFLALLRAEAKTLQAALDFLADAGRLGRAIASGDDPACAPKPPTQDAAIPSQTGAPGGLRTVRVYDPVPMPMVRMAGRERGQLLVESASRKALHAFVDAWLARLGATKTTVRWQLEIDPLEI